MKFLLEEIVRLKCENAELEKSNQDLDIQLHSTAKQVCECGTPMSSCFAVDNEEKSFSSVSER